MRSRPVTVRQSANSYRSAAGFATTSVLAKQLVASLNYLLPGWTMKHVYYRLLAALLQWKSAQFLNPVSPERNSTFFKGFRLLPHIAFENRVKLNVDIDYGINGLVKIQLGSFIPLNALSIPPGCNSFEIRIVVLSCDPFTGSMQRCQTGLLHVDEFTSPVMPFTATLPIPDAANTLVLVGLSVVYEKGIENPAAIVSSFFQ